MIIVAAMIVGCSMLAASFILYRGLVKVSCLLSVGEETEFVSMDKLMAEQYPEQYATPENLLFEDDFSLL